VKPSELKDLRLQRRPRGRGIWLVLAGMAGALTAFFADPERGNARRKQAIDRVGSFTRHTSRRAERVMRGLTAETRGWSRKLRHLRLARPEVDDLTLRDRVESELFRDPEVPKGNINLDVADGRVTLRGQLRHPEQIRQLQDRVSRLPGVQQVQSFLHLEGTEAPNKAEVRDLSIRG
jgi:BON domain-containing protein